MTLEKNGQSQEARTHWRADQEPNGEWLEAVIFKLSLRVIVCGSLLRRSAQARKQLISAHHASASNPAFPHTTSRCVQSLPNFAVGSLGSAASVSAPAEAATTLPHRRVRVVTGTIAGLGGCGLDGRRCASPVPRSSASSSAAPTALSARRARNSGRLASARSRLTRRGGGAHVVHVGLGYSAPRQVHHVRDHRCRGCVPRRRVVTSTVCSRQPSAAAACDSMQRDGADSMPIRRDLSARTSLQIM